MFPETSCQCPRPQVITHWWPASVSSSQISIVHSSLLSSVASRSLSFVKHSANIHNLLLFLFLLNSNGASSLSLKAMYIASISQLTNIFGPCYQKSIFLSSSVSFLSSGVWEPRTGRCDHISGISVLTLSQMHISCIVTKYLQQMCVFCPGWRAFSHPFRGLRKFKIIMRGEQNDGVLCDRV